MRHRLKNAKYRICFQTKNKVWIYKNSRLRNFYRIRNRIVLDSTKMGKQFLITKNMKWTVARRKMVPYFWSKSRFYFFYKNLFFTKQRLKSFYGGLKEYQIRNIFKNTWNKEHNFRTNVFLGALEQRLGMVMFRMRLLPTIYACNQLIRHHGILVNNTLISLPSFRVKIGDFVSIPQNYWLLFYNFLFERLRHRFWGQSLLVWRKEFFLRKIQFYRLRKKNFYIANFHLVDKFALRKTTFNEKFSLLNSIIIKLYNQNSNSRDLKVLQVIFLTFYQSIKPIINIIEKNLPEISWWNRKHYSQSINIILMNIYYLDIILYKYDLILSRFLVLKHIALLNLEQISTVEKNSLIKQYNKVLDDLVFEEDSLTNGEEISKRIFRNTQRSLKKTKYFKNKFMRYKRFFKFLLRKLKYRKLKKRTFKNFCRKHHWYVPSYLEVDYLTLRACFIDYPKTNQIHYGFLCSFKKIVSFYKERAL